MQGLSRSLVWLLAKLSVCVCVCVCVCVLTFWERSGCGAVGYRDCGGVMVLHRGEPVLRPRAGTKSRLNARLMVLVFGVMRGGVRLIRAKRRFSAKSIVVR